MKAAPFDYVAVSAVDEALAQLAEGGDDAMILAGGQTLVPMLAMRLARPSILIDINGVADFAGIERQNGTVRIKAGTRQSAALASPLISSHLPLLAGALPFVGHQQTRNRGTVGGSAAHGDPAAEIPLVAVALDAAFTLRSTGGTRTVAARDFYQGPMMSDRNPDECLTEVAFPVWDDSASVGTGFEEVSERHGDFAIVSAAAQIAVDAGGVCRRAALAVGGAHGTPVRLGDCEDQLVSETISDELIDDALAGMESHLDPADDSHGSAGYRRRVARVLMARAIRQAVDATQGPTA